MKAANTYWTHNPIRSKNQDELGRNSFSKSVANTIIRWSDPASYVIAIYGSWGSGKTSVLNLINEALTQPTTQNTGIQIFTVHFNPWRFTSEEQMLRDLLLKSAHRLGVKITTWRERIGLRFGKHLLTLATMLGRKEIAEGISQWISPAELEELIIRLQWSLKYSNRRLVIFVDDIDRLDDDEIHSLFKIIKLTVNLDQTTYVLALDPESVTHSLSKRYHGNEIGRRFLEKIVQLPLLIPHPGIVAMERFIITGINQILIDSEIGLTSSERKELDWRISECFLLETATPRQIKLFTSNLAFSLSALGGEVDTIDLLLIEWMRTTYPRLHDFVCNHPEQIFFDTVARTFLRDHNDLTDLKEMLDSGLEGLVRDSYTIAVKLLTALFPKLSKAFSKDDVAFSFGNTTEERHQRISDFKYYHRYSSYSIPPGDIPDRDVDTLIRLAEGGNVESVIQRIDQLLLRGDARTLLLRLEHIRATITKTAASSLAIAIMTNGKRFSRRDWSNGPSTATRAVNLVRILTFRLQEANRLEFISELIRQANPLPFAGDLIDVLLSTDTPLPMGESQLNTDAIRAVGTTLANRISLESESEPIFIKYSRESADLFEYWSRYRGRDEVNEYVSSILARSVNYASDIIAEFIPRSWFSGKDQPDDLVFDPPAFERIERTMDTGLLFDALQRAYGNIPRINELPQGTSVLGNGKFVEQFVWCYEHR
jgi:KAP family P-loop domain